MPPTSEVSKIKILNTNEMSFFNFSYKTKIFNNYNMKHIIGAKCSLGQKKRGVFYAPDYFITTHTVKIDSFYKYQTLYNTINKLKTNKIITIGGDHSIATSTVTAINDKCIKNNKKLSVIWVDAHADINTYQTSNSGNIHGMPVAFILGLCSFSYLKFDYFLQPSQIHYIGLRNVEIKEYNFIKKLGINYYKENDVNNYGIQSILKDIKNKVNDNDIHISLDVDAIDPLIIPSTGTIEKNGLSLNDTLKIITFFDKANSLDIAEFNPLIGNTNELDISMYAIDKIINRFQNN